MHQHETVVLDTPVDRAMARLIRRLADCVVTQKLTKNEAELIIDDTFPKLEAQYQDCLKAEHCCHKACPFKE